MKLSLYTLSMCFAILPVMLLAGSVIYRLCYDTNSKNDNCRSSETVEFKGHHRIIPTKAQGVSRLIFFQIANSQDIGISAAIIAYQLTWLIMAWLVVILRLSTLSLSDVI
jgi:hypothetical protein